MASDFWIVSKHHLASLWKGSARWPWLSLFILGGWLGGVAISEYIIAYFFLAVALVACCSWVYHWPGIITARYWTLTVKSFLWVVIACITGYLGIVTWNIKADSPWSHLHRTTRSIASAPRTPAKPEIAADFVQATGSPAILVFNNSDDPALVLKDPEVRCELWDFNKKPPLALPTVVEQEPNGFIKYDSGLFFTVANTPEVKPLLSDGDRVFGFVELDCPDCENRYYWLSFVYGHLERTWFSRVPSGVPVNFILFGQRMSAAKWNVDQFMLNAPHGKILSAQKPSPTLEPRRQQ